MLWKCCTQHASKFGKLSSGHRTGKDQYSFQSQRKSMRKNIQTTIFISHANKVILISHSSKVILKIFQAKFQLYLNWELSDVQAGFRKVRGNRDQIVNINSFIEKARQFQKNTYLCFNNYTQAFDCVDHNKLWKILKRDGNSRSPYLPPKKSICRSWSNS